MRYCSRASNVIGPLRVFRNPDAVVRHIRRARRNQPHVEQAARLPRIALVDRDCRGRRAGTSDRSARPARPGRGPRRPPGRSRTPCARRRRWPCSSSQTSNASTVPPGKKWPIFRVRTTTSSRTVDPGVSTGCARSSGAASSPTSRITTGAFCSASSPTAKPDIASAAVARRGAPSACPPLSRRSARRRRCRPSRTLT